MASRPAIGFAMGARRTGTTVGEQLNPVQCCDDHAPVMLFFGCTNPGRVAARAER